MKIKCYILIFTFYVYVFAFSQKNDSINVFGKNKFSFSFIYNRPFVDYYEIIYKPEDTSFKNIDKIKTKMNFFPEGGFRFNYSLCFLKQKYFYHFFRINFYFHRQYIEFKDTVYVMNNQKKHYNEYVVDILNLAFLPEYVFRFKLNSWIGFQAGIGYNYSYTVHSNFELYKLFFPFWLNKNYFINNYQVNIAVLFRITKKIFIEQSYYWNTNPLWNKYLGFMIGVNL